MKENEELVIRPADKGGGVIMQDLSDYLKEAHNILLDIDYYEPISEDPFPDLFNRYQTLINKGLVERVISKKKNTIFWTSHNQVNLCFITCLKYTNTFKIHLVAQLFQASKVLPAICPSI